MFLVKNGQSLILLKIICLEVKFQKCIFFWLGVLELYYGLRNPVLTRHLFVFGRKLLFRENSIVVPVYDAEI